MAFVTALISISIGALCLPFVFALKRPSSWPETSELFRKIVGVMSLASVCFAGGHLVGGHLELSDMVWQFLLLAPMVLVVLYEVAMRIFATVVLPHYLGGDKEGDGQDND